MQTLRRAFIVRGCILIWLLSLTACTTVQPTVRHEALSAWLEMPYEEALYQLGRPLEVFEDNTSGRVLVYNAVTEPPYAYDAVPDDSIRVYEDLVWYDALARTVPTRYAQTYDLLYVDRDGRIYSYQSNESDRTVRVQYEQGLIIGGIAAALILTILYVVALNEASY